MTLLPSEPELRTAVLDVDQDTPLFVCPMCHTPESPTHRAIRSGTGWQCVRCGQHWDARRLSAVAAYTAWTVERTTVGAAGGERVSTSRNVPIEQRGGRT
jgi:ribosomal protein L37AE/L43A